MSVIRGGSGTCLCVSVCVCMRWTSRYIAPMHVYIYHHMEAFISTWAVCIPPLDVRHCSSYLIIKYLLLYTKAHEVFEACGDSELSRSMVMRSRCAGDALDPPLC